METLIFLLLVVYYMFGCGYAIGRDGRDENGLLRFLAIVLLWPVFVGASVGDAS